LWLRRLKIKCHLALARHDNIVGFRRCLGRLVLLAQVVHFGVRYVASHTAPTSD